MTLNHFPLRWGGGGRGLDAIGTQPIAAARAKGNQAATDAMAHNCLSSTFSVTPQTGSMFWRPILDIFNIAFPGAWQTALTW